MPTRIELIGITYTKIPAGKEVHVDIHKDYRINSSDELSEDDIIIIGFSSIFESNRVKFKKDFWGMNFHFIPNGYTDSHSFGGIQYNVERAGEEEVFRDFIPDLIRLGEFYLVELGKVSGFNQEKPDTVSFLTKWKYSGCTDYDGEYNDKWELIGPCEVSE